MMMRKYLALALLGFAAGCGQPDAPPTRAVPVPGHVEASPDLQVPGKAQRTATGAGQPQDKSYVAKSKGGFTRIKVGDEGAARRDLERDKTAFYPVLRNYEEGDLFAKNVVHKPVARGLAVFASRKTRTPSGGTGIDYVLERQLADYGLDGPKVLDLCYENFFKEKLEVKAAKQGDDLMLQFMSSGGLVTALLGHSTTYAKISKMLKTEDFAILIDGPDILAATPIGSSFEAKFPELVAKSPHKEDPLNLDPAAYHWTRRGGLTLVPGPRDHGSENRAGEKGL